MKSEQMMNIALAALFVLLALSAFLYFVKSKQ
jgi:LPXTG-motif cell wall-anchored protein